MMVILCLYYVFIVLIYLSYIIDYTRSLKQYDIPDYSSIKDIFRNLAERKGLRLVYYVYSKYSSMYKQD